VSQSGPLRSLTSATAAPHTPLSPPQPHVPHALAPNRNPHNYTQGGRSETISFPLQAEKLNQAHPLDTLIQQYWLPTIRGAVELHRSNTQGAIEVLKPASTYEAGEPPPFLMLGTMYPVYVRGQAYLKIGAGQQAALEFKKIVNHRGIVLNFPFGVLAHLQLGRAYQLAGDEAKAHAAYQDFFALWKDADPDIPILKEAKAEYAKLQ
jgi:eukaryotic-like serine/threonine-protein kinase